MEAGTIVRWLKSEGDQVKKGEPLFELDTDKVTQEVEAEASGVLLKILVAEGEVPVGTAVAYVGEQGEDVPDTKGAEPAPEPAQEEPPREEREPEPEPEQAAAPAETAQVAASGNGGRIKASPLARRIARERGIDLAALSGTGPEGRIVAEDVERAAVRGPAAPVPVPAAVPGADVERVPLSSLQRTIVRRRSDALAAPVFQ